MLIIGFWGLASVELNTENRDLAPYFKDTVGVELTPPSLGVTCNFHY